MRNGEGSWEVALREHRKALQRFLEAVEEVAPEEWEAAPAGKWSAAQVTEHLALTYEALLRELEEGAGMTPRASRWQQRFLRWVLLPHILFHRSFPVRARSPREIRPQGGVPAGEAAQRLHSGGEAFLERLQTARSSGPHRLTHPYFGPLPLLRALRFATVHMEHHLRQMRRWSSTGER